MSLRRLHHAQPESFAFTPANAEWAQQQIAKYPEGRQASAVIPLLWRAQEQEGWVSQRVIEEVAQMLDMAEIRVLEVATFYFMFQLQPVGSVAHIQVCGTTSCMICGAEDLIAVCKDRIAPNPHELSADGKFSWEEVECLGACSNAPMAQIGKDYYEDLTVENFGKLLDRFAAGEVPKPGPQNGRWASEPVLGLTSLKGDPVHAGNASVDLATSLGDTIKRITGDEAPTKVPLVSESPIDPVYGATASGDVRGLDEAKAEKEKVGRPKLHAPSEGLEGPSEEDKPELLTGARGGSPDNLKKIKGVGPKLEGLLNSLGVWHFDQIANWTEREVAWVDHNLEGFKGRIERDDWVAQSKILAAGGETEFSKKST